MSDETAVTQVMKLPGGRTVQVGRASLSIFLLIVGLTILMVGTLCLYVNRNVLDADRLADRAVAALDSAEVQQFLGKKTADAVIAQVPELASERARIEGAANAVAASDPFETVVRKTIGVTEDLLVERDIDDTAMKLQDVGELVRERLADTDPALAARVPADLDAQVADFGRTHAVGNVLQILDKISLLGLVLPPIALVLLAGSVFAGGDRRAAAMRLGIGLVIWAVLGFLVLELGRLSALDQVPEGLARDAAGATWDEMLGTLRTWFIITGVGGIALAGGAFWQSRRDVTPALA